MCTESKGRITPSTMPQPLDTAPSNPTLVGDDKSGIDDCSDEAGSMEAKALVIKADDSENGQEEEHCLLSISPSGRKRKLIKHATLASSFCLLSALLVYFVHRQSTTRGIQWISGQFHRRPIAIIHIGPRKTASTAIQYVLKHNATQTYLEKDNFMYLGKTIQQHWGSQMHSYMVSCVEDQHTLSDECRQDGRWTNFTATLHHLKWQRTNVILSDEGLLRFLSENPPALQLFADAFAGFDVRIVAAYRRYYQWLLSEYSQEVKPRKKMKLAQKLERLIRFDEWYHNKTQQSNSNEVGKSSAYYPLDKSSLQPWLSVFRNVEIFNMHDGEDVNLIERFICSLRVVPKVCEAAKGGLLPIPEEKNSAPPQSLFEAQLIGLYVQREKIVSRSIPLDDVVAEIEKLMNRTNVKVPRECLGYGDLSDIELKTLKDEKDLLPAFALAKGKIDSARQGFRQAVADNKYCGIRFDLIEKQWKAFFHRLRTDFAKRQEKSSN